MQRTVSCCLHCAVLIWQKVTLHLRQTQSSSWPQLCKSTSLPYTSKHISGTFASPTYIQAHFFCNKAQTRGLLWSQHCKSASLPHTSKQFHKEMLIFIESTVFCFFLLWHGNREYQCQSNTNLTFSLLNFKMFYFNSKTQDGSRSNMTNKDINFKKCWEAFPFGEFLVLLFFF